jgi:3-deoxy-D-manno-octulosonate 8-phosphate phosphatase (KDO 8-P phosphatase)
MPLDPAALLDRLRGIKLILMDVDGVLTDGTIWFVPTADGTWGETKGFHTQDGIALQWLYRAGIITGMISGRKSKATQMRAEIAHCRYLYMGDTDKIAAMEEVLRDSGLTKEEIAFLGDDLTDAVCFHRCGLPVAVANAAPEVKAAAAYITRTPGGQGALREFAEMVLKAQDKWADVLRHYELGSPATE